MKLVSLQTVSLAAIALALGACASKPPPQEDVAVVTPPPERTPTARPTPTPTATPTPQNVGPAAGTVQDFIVNVGDRVYFDTDRYNLDASDRAVLDRQAAWLRLYPNVSIRVSGNCDERGTREYNLGLGERRANSVKEYLVNSGIAASRIETISYGKEMPIDGRSTEAAWAKNRNSHTEILNGAVS
ncbi:MAG: peptidoglycan-associated lipoprotein [Ponticaulis sp.]|nr:peptidoglycan-associated lipoprotein [Ponticaulis sp.]|tara:strand:- start:45110 stop:45667 length:558 start_codon:yes stop_codon:yes gene_type:complete